MIQKGKNYLVGLNETPTIEPKQGGWAHIRYQGSEKKISVSPVLTTESWTSEPTEGWSSKKVVHIYAMESGPAPQLMQDELVYRDNAGNREARTIWSFQALDKK